MSDKYDFTPGVGPPTGAPRKHRPFGVARATPNGQRFRSMVEEEPARAIEGARRPHPWPAASQPRGSSLNVHGDAHAGNLLRRPKGQIVLCDFDATCVGPWQVDLVPVAVGEARFGREGAHRTLAAAYGYDVATDPAWPLLREARELKMVAAAVPRDESPQRGAELRRVAVTSPLSAP